MFKALLGLPATVWLLGLISLFNDSASELLYPLVPLYLASVLMAGPKALGIIEGIAEATSSLLKLFSGVLADRTAATKRWVVGGYSLAAVARPLLAFAASWPVVLALRFADRVGKGLRASPWTRRWSGQPTTSGRGNALTAASAITVTRIWKSRICMIPTMPLPPADSCEQEFPVLIGSCGTCARCRPPGGKAAICTRRVAGRRRRPAGAAGLWFTLRLTVSMAGFYLLFGPDRSLPRLSVALLTFIAARVLLIRRLWPAPATSRHTP